MNRVVLLDVKKTETHEVYVDYMGRYYDVNDAQAMILTHYSFTLTSTVEWYGETVVVNDNDMCLSDQAIEAIVTDYLNRPFDHKVYDRRFLR